jgi:putative sigma-54 modulation protein
MLQKIEVRGVHMNLDENLQKYITKKIGRLDKYVPRSNRESSHTEVQLKEAKSSTNRHATCEVTMHLPHETLFVKESTMNMYAAVDIVEAKLKQQLRKYKELHHGGTMHRRLFARLGREAV